MSERGIELLETADGQLSQLIHLLSARGGAALSLPCPGREKLGDGTVAALALHTADNYLRIAGFLKTASQMPRAHGRTGRDRHRLPRLVRALGHTPPGHSESAHDEGMRDGAYAAENADLESLLERLSAARDALDPLADMTDERLATVPPAGSFRFCDGQRTLEQVVAGLLNHQGRQLDALNTALA